MTANRDSGKVKFCHWKFRVFKPGDDHVLPPVHERVHREIDGEDQPGQEDNEPENPAKQQTYICEGFKLSQIASISSA